MKICFLTRCTVARKHIPQDGTPGYTEPKHICQNGPIDNEHTQTIQNHCFVNVPKRPGFPRDGGFPDQLNSQIDIFISSDTHSE